MPCQETLVPVHVRTTSRRNLARCSIAPGSSSTRGAGAGATQDRTRLGRDTNRRHQNESGRHHGPLGSQLARRGGHEELRRGKEMNTRIHDEESKHHDDSRRGKKTNTRIHDELEERRQTQGITTRRQGEYEHEVSGECEDQTKRGITTGVARRRCHEGDCHQRTTRQRTP